MKVLLVFFLSLLLSMTLQAQHPPDDERVAILLSGRKNPEDQEIIASLGIGSLDSLLTRLKGEQDQNKVPLYCRLIGLKYRQFSKELTREKKREIITTLCSKIRAIKDEGSTSYLIQSSLEDMHGIHHPEILQLIDAYLESDVEWTRKAAQSLKDSLKSTAIEPEEDTPPLATPVPKPPPVVQTPIAKIAPKSKSPTSTPSAEPASSTRWPVVAAGVAAALGLLWVWLKKQR